MSDNTSGFLKNHAPWIVTVILALFVAVGKFSSMDSQISNLNRDLEQIRNLSEKVNTNNTNIEVINNTLNSMNQDISEIKSDIRSVRDILVRGDGDYKLNGKKR